MGNVSKQFYPQSRSHHHNYIKDEQTVISAYTVTRLNKQRRLYDQIE